MWTRRIFVLVFSCAAGMALFVAPASGARSQSGLRERPFDPNSGPSRRCCMGFAYFPSPVNKVVMYGGIDKNNNPVNGTWLYNGTTWSPLTTATDPGPLGETRMVYDDALGKIVMFGGRSTSSDASASNATWLFDGSDWTKCEGVVGCNNGTLPAARTSPALSYDGAQLVLFGGAPSTGIGTPLPDTWTFGGGPPNWTQCTTSNGCPSGSTPPPRSSGGMAFDGTDAVMFGGLDANGNTKGDTWLWDRTNASQHWSACTDFRCPTGSPASRSGHRIAFNIGLGKIVLFGGFTGSYNNPTLQNDTWFWTSSGGWVACDSSNGCTTTPPSVRCCVGLAYSDGPLHTIVLFGGGAQAGKVGDTWTWDTTNSWVCHLSC